MKDLICDREFGGVVIDGVELRIVVEWFRPARDRGSWRCDWTIHRPSKDPLEGYSCGVDSAQALLLAMGLAGDIIQHEYPQAFWLEAGGDLGLPGISGR